MTTQQRSRQAKALSALEEQLKSGVKTEKKSFNKTTKLTPKDVERIEKEIEILKNLKK